MEIDMEMRRVIMQLKSLIVLGLPFVWHAFVSLSNESVQLYQLSRWAKGQEAFGSTKHSGSFSNYQISRLKVQAVMSFHQCGRNVGDSCTIPLPKWAVEEMEKDHDLAYTDKWGRRNYEYIPLGCDTVPVLDGRTPVQCYSDFMRAFNDKFEQFLGKTIVEIQVGMGPAGELGNPSYPEQNGTWKSGIGAFQCYNKMCYVR